MINLFEKINKDLDETNKKLTNALTILNEILKILEDNEDNEDEVTE